MKSSDIEKSKKILNEINFLECEIKVMNHAKENKLSVTISCESKSIWFERDVSQNIIDISLKELNLKKEKCIKKLAELGVEYVDDGAK